MRIADIALPTFPDEQALFGDKDAEACADRLAALGVKEIVVKDGTEPALVVSGEEKCWFHLSLRKPWTPLAPAIASTAPILPHD